MEVSQYLWHTMKLNYINVELKKGYNYVLLVLSFQLEVL